MSTAVPLNQRRAILLGLSAVACWATVATAFKLALAELSPRQVVLLASMVSVLVFALVISWQRRWGEALQLIKQRRLHYTLLGTLNPAIYYLVLFMAYAQLPAQQAQAINYSWAMAYSLLAIPVLGQRLNRRDLIALSLAYAGVVVIATGGEWSFSQTNWVGVGLALLSTLLWAGYWLLNTKNSDPPTLALFWCFSCGTAVLLLAEVLWPQVWPAWSTALVSYPAALYVGVFEMGVTFLLWLHALRVAEKAAQISALIFLSPIASLALIWWILGEPISLTTYLGLGAILCGLYLQRGSATAAD